MNRIHKSRCATAEADVAEAVFTTPLGRMRAQATEYGITRLEWAGARGGRETPSAGPAGRHLARLIREVGEYLAGRRRDFTVPLDLAAHTAFRQKAWATLRTIPYGQTATYGQIAKQVGCGSARAVGQACGANPVPLLTPCHRVVAAEGLGGFSSGLARKRHLLEVEKTNRGAKR